MISADERNAELDKWIAELAYQPAFRLKVRAQVTNTVREALRATNGDVLMRWALAAPIKNAINALSERFVKDDLLSQEEKPFRPEFEAKLIRMVVQMATADLAVTQQELNESTAG